MNAPKSDKTLFPMSAKYDPDWVRRCSYDGLTLYCLESLCRVLNLKKGMRILDLGCGWGISSIFLAREFDAQVWAVDLDFSPSDTYRRALDAGCGDCVFPIRTDARKLPFAEEFFDAVIAIDSYSYFGLDERYPSYLSKFLKPGGLVGLLDGCFTRELNTLDDVPDYLKTLYHDKEDPWYCCHAVPWWKRLWEKAGHFSVTCAEILPENDFLWQRYIENCKDMPSEQILIDALNNDTQKLMALFRLVARRL